MADRVPVLVRCVSQTFTEYCWFCGYIGRGSSIFSQLRTSKHTLTGFLQVRVIVGIRVPVNNCELDANILTPGSASTDE